jgi:hypothetical protein
MPQLSILKEGEQVSADDPRLFNMGDLAKILGVDRGYVRRMKSSGFKMPGGRSTVRRAHEFLDKCEDFAPVASGKSKVAS